MKVPQNGLEVFIDARIVHFPVDVDKSIAESGHLPERFPERLRQDPLFDQDGETVRIVLGDAEILRRDDMVGDVNAALNGNHEVVLGVADSVGVSEERLLRNSR